MKIEDVAAHMNTSMRTVSIWSSRFEKAGHQGRKELTRHLQLKNGRPFVMLGYCPCLVAVSVVFSTISPKSLTCSLKNLIFH